MKRSPIKKCPVCDEEHYREYRTKCSICGLSTCPECSDDYAEYLSFNNDLDDIESKIFRRVCATFDSGYPVVCKKCFEVRTIEILRTYPMETVGLLVNATLLPMSAIKSRLSE